MRIVNIVEDDATIRNATADYLEVSGYVVRKFQSATDFIDTVTQSEQSVTLLAFSISGGRGLSVLEDIQRRGYETTIVMTSDCEDTNQIVQAMKIGAIDILQKPYHSQELENVIRSSMEVSKKISTKTPADTAAEAVLDSLTAEEDSILRLLCNGWTVKQVAAKLDISVRTVHYRKNSIFDKLGVKNRTEAMSRLAGLGLNSEKEMFAH